MNRHDPGKRRGLWWWISRGVVSFALMLCVALTVGYMLLRSEPARYTAYKVYLADQPREQRLEHAEKLKKTIEAICLSDIDEHQQVVRNAVTEDDDDAIRKDDAGQLKAIRDVVLNGGTENDIAKDKRVDRVERIKLTQRQVNMLVEEELDGILKKHGYRMPREVTNPLLEVGSERVQVTFDYVGERLTQNFTVDMGYTIRRDGVVVLEMDAVDAGRLPVPAEKAAKLARKHGGRYEDKLREVEAMLDELSHLEIRPAIKIKHGRMVSVEGVRVVNGDVELAIRVQDGQTYREQKKTAQAFVREAVVKY
ncbi:hypothetical protein KS4_31720 [Poriferisphaera corsica]|uniref:Uncharacterized protein n=1 Tax=Poriferisphaera corsica TaxID=2528020 RepID=A0A517YXZ2_9BACT|nr:hypothetical protein [Poriferisphaera corsica]QDU35094.1 hypothetical protein KS4_31720 [Poriferisphaera corsica]